MPDEPWQRRAERPKTTRTLRRSRTPYVGGVVGGLAEYLEMDPRTLRLAVAAAAVLSLGVALLPYGLLWWLLPAPDAA